MVKLHKSDNILLLLDRLQQNIIPLNPDYIILFTAYNNRIYFDPSIFWSIDKFLSEHIWLVTLIKEWIGVHYLRDVDSLKYNLEGPMDISKVNKRVRDYRNKLEEFNMICKKNNISLIVGTQPHWLPKAYKNFKDLQNRKVVRRVKEKIESLGKATHYENQYIQMALFNFEMIDFANDNNLLLFDGISIFPKTRDNYFLDQIHLNQNGSKILANNLFDFLVDKKVIYNSLSTQ